MYARSVKLLCQQDGRHVNSVMMSFDPNEKQSVICEYNTQVEASIKAKGQLYYYLSVTWLFSEVVGPTHLETICSQKGIGQQEAMFYRLV